MSGDLVLGVDVSHHQDPQRIAWGELAREHRFVYVRATYGKARDGLCVEHVKRARAVGLAIGLYHFWRPSQDAVSQWGAFAETASAVRLGPGDLLPALDIETDPVPSPQPVDRSWSDPVRVMATALAGRWTGCVLYANASDFAALGNPAWIAEHPIWIAHWTQASEPLCPPGRTWAVWQRRVSVMPSIYGGKLDQNVARRPLPVIEDRDRFVHSVEQQIALTVDQTIRNRKP